MSIEEAGAPTPAEPAAGPQPLGETMRQLQERFAPRVEEAKEQLGLLNQKVKGFIRENPGTSLLLAVGTGYLIGKLVSRR